MVPLLGDEHYQSANEGATKDPNSGDEPVVVKIECLESLEFGTCQRRNKHRPVRGPYKRRSKQYQCGICDKSFSCETRLLDHTQTYAEHTPVTCSACTGGFHKITAFVKHKCRQVNKKVHICSFCGDSFTDFPKLTSHIVEHRALKTLSCTICGKEFKNKSNLLIHRRTHTNERPFPCNLCEKHFKTPWDCARHERVHTGEKNYKCMTCGRRLCDSSALANHLLTHSTDRPHKCTDCDKSFKSNKLLKSHRLTHSGIRPHECSYCGKTFSWRTSLTNHIRIHTGERPYSCSSCGKTFVERAALRKHEHAVHSKATMQALKQLNSGTTTNAESSGNKSSYTEKAGLELTEASTVGTKLIENAKQISHAADKNSSSIHSVSDVARMSASKKLDRSKNTRHVAESLIDSHPLRKETEFDVRDDSTVHTQTASNAVQVVHKDSNYDALNAEYLHRHDPTLTTCTAKSILHSVVEKSLDLSSERHAYLSGNPVLEQGITSNEAHETLDQNHHYGLPIDMLTKSQVSHHSLVLKRKHYADNLEQKQQEFEMHKFHRTENQQPRNDAYAPGAMEHVSFATLRQDESSNWPIGMQHHPTTVSAEHQTQRFPSPRVTSPMDQTHPLNSQQPDECAKQHSENGTPLPETSSVEHLEHHFPIIHTSKSLGPFHLQSHTSDVVNVQKNLPNSELFPSQPNHALLGHMEHGHVDHPHNLSDSIGQSKSAQVHHVQPLLLAGQNTPIHQHHVILNEPHQHMQNLNTQSPSVNELHWQRNGDRTLHAQMPRTQELSQHHHHFSKPLVDRKLEFMSPQLMDEAVGSKKQPYSTVFPSSFDHEKLCYNAGSVRLPAFMNATILSEYLSKPKAHANEQADSNLHLQNGSIRTSKQWSNH